MTCASKDNLWIFRKYLLIFNWSSRLVIFVLQESEITLSEGEEASRSLMKFWTNLEYWMPLIFTVWSWSRHMSFESSDAK